MKIISKYQVSLANFQYSNSMLMLDNTKIINDYSYLYIPFNYDLIPHNQLQDFYEEIAKQCKEIWFIKGYEEKCPFILIPYNEFGVLNLNKSLCYAFKDYKDDLLNNKIGILINSSEYNINVEFEPIEQLELSASFIKTINNYG